MRIMVWFFIEWFLWFCLDKPIFVFPKEEKKILYFPFYSPLDLFFVLWSTLFSWKIYEKFICRCIPFRYRSCDESDGTESEKIVEVLMINSTSGPGLLFPKVFVAYSLYYLLELD